MEDIQQLFSRLLAGSASLKASDLHFRVGAPPFVRVDGRLAKTNAPPMTAPQIVEFIVQTSGRPTETAWPHSWEYSFEQGPGRFRGHVFRERGAWALALRVMPVQVPSFQDLRLPAVVKALSEPAPGLVLITGPTGSGKSTTAAAMLAHAANAQARHIVTIEDPVEYRLNDTPSCVSQREIGRDAESYEEALHAALREDPDMLFIGEIRDAESLRVVIQAAETGHHVLSTFHTGSALKTVQRLLAMLAGEDQAVSRARLADALRGVICQRLLPRKGGRGHGRILCSEVMVNNYAIVECIKDPTKLVNIPAVIERSGDQHMQTFDKNLIRLVTDQLVDPEVAVAFATNPGEIRRTLRMPGLES